MISEVYRAIHVLCVFVIHEWYYGGGDGGGVFLTPACLMDCPHNCRKWVTNFILLTPYRAVHVLCIFIICEWYSGGGEWGGVFLTPVWLVACPHNCRKWVTNFILLTPYRAIHVLCVFIICEWYWGGGDGEGYS